MPQPRSIHRPLLLTIAGGLLAIGLIAPRFGFAQEEAAGAADDPPGMTLGKAAAAEDGAEADADASPADAPGDATRDDPGEADGEGSDEVMRDLLRQRRQPPPATDPERDPERRDVPQRIGVPAPSVDVAPDVLGIAPGQAAPELRREGEFIVSRRGRLVRSSDGAHVLFVFQGDGRESPEAPMIMMPCRMLESMEDIIAERGESVEFILSGEVFVYRKHNYLLPTMMTIAVDRGNLDN